MKNIISKMLLPLLPFLIILIYISVAMAQTVFDDWYWGSENGRLLHKYQVVQDEIKRNKEDIDSMYKRIEELKKEIEYREKILKVIKCKLEYVKARKDVGTVCDYILGK